MANIMKNPFDAKKEAMENILHASMSDRLVESAQKIYQDLPFAQENRLKFQLAKILSWTAGAVSFATACFALSYVLTSTLGTYLSRKHDGLPSELDRDTKHRVKALGNSICPKIAAVLFSIIKNLES
jgi:hypothetical protein